METVAYFLLPKRTTTEAGRVTVRPLYVPAMRQAGKLNGWAALYRQNDCLVLVNGSVADLQELAAKQKAHVIHYTAAVAIKRSCDVGPVTPRNISFGVRMQRHGHQVVLGEADLHE